MLKGPATGSYPGYNDAQSANCAPPYGRKSKFIDATKRNEIAPRRAKESVKAFTDSFIFYIACRYDGLLLSLLRSAAIILQLGRMQNIITTCCKMTNVQADSSTVSPLGKLLIRAFSRAKQGSAAVALLMHPRYKKSYLS